MEANVNSVPASTGPNFLGLKGELRFTVPLLPPSVNHYKLPARRGGWYRSAEALAFVDAVCIFSGKQHVLGDWYEVELTFYLPPAKQRVLASNDADNFLKVALDALGRAGVISNDGRVLDLIVHKRFCRTEREACTAYHVTEMGDVMEGATQGEAQEGH
jgi:Holliday junction resolvase RusA-like endonuclease